MSSKPFETLRLICRLVIMFRIMVPGVTGRRNSNLDNFIVENQKPHRIHDYFVQRTLKNEGIGDALEYTSEYIEPETSPEQLPELIVDYANLIRNDIILLDNSIETRTRKRGNIKVEKYNQAIPARRCSCEFNKESINLGEDFYPRFVENITCSKSLCPEPYDCQEKVLSMTLLKRKSQLTEETEVALPYELSHRWIAVRRPLTIGCVCAKDYIRQLEDS